MAKHGNPYDMPLALESALRAQRAVNQIENRPPRHRVDWINAHCRPQAVIMDERLYRTGNWGPTIVGSSRWVSA